MTVADNARIDAYVQQVVDQAPPLTAEQRVKLRDLLRPVQATPAPRAAA